MKTETPTQSKYNDKQNDLADKIIREKDRVKRWKMVHELLRKQNKKARKEQDKVMEDAKFFRDNKLIKSTKTKTMGLRWGVALPPTTYTAIVQADILIDGKSDLQHPDKEAEMDLKSTNQIVRDLEKAFPQYKVAK
jgi:hypothetical protein